MLNRTIDRCLKAQTDDDAPAALHTIDDAIRRIDATPVNGYGAIYQDGSTRLYYFADYEDLALLAEYMDDPDTRSDAYSLWCAATESRGYATYDDAFASIED